MANEGMQESNVDDSDWKEWWAQKILEVIVLAAALASVSSASPA